MTIDLTGKIALVTGGGNGIGAASCRALAKTGARVAVIDRDGEAAEKVASEIGGGATGHALDVAEGRGLQAARLGDRGAGGRHRYPGQFRRHDHATDDRGDAERGLGPD